MAVGVSTACLYPMQTEDALRTLGALGIQTCEIFLNSISETSPDFAQTLKGIADFYGMRIVSVHPFSSFAEPFLLFDVYGRRFQDGLDFYRRTFEVTAALGAQISIIHGAQTPMKIPEAAYFERFAALVQAGKAYGVTVAQENVNRHASAEPAFLDRMRASLGPEFHLVFDIKQAVRAGYAPLPFFNRFSKEILHLHVSDHRPGQDCIAPGKGTFDFAALRDAAAQAGCTADWIVELYRAGFGTPEELTDAVHLLQQLGIR